MNRWLMSCLLVPCLGVALLACDDDDDIGDDDFRPRPHRDSGAAEPSASAPGVCRLSDCPAPVMGVACCTPDAECGMDPTGVGLACVPNPAVGSTRECVLEDCPVPVVGNACCTPFAQCGFDPFATGVFCFAFPPPINGDAGVPPEVCDPAACPDPDAGGYGCCLPNGECGVDPFGSNACFPPVPAGDGGLVPIPPISTEPPDHPSVTGECPSFLGVFGPVWGCCSNFGVCGTFASGECLLPVGTELPVGPEDEDAGAGGSSLRCTPPGIVD